MPNIEAAMRPIIYQIEHEEWHYAISGTLFVVQREDRCYGVTCRHVIRDAIASLFVAPIAKLTRGMLPAQICGVAFPNRPDSDIGDIAVIKFSQSTDCQFFENTGFPIADDTCGSSRGGDFLRVFGCLNENSHVCPEARKIVQTYARLGFRDIGAGSADLALRAGTATYDKSTIGSLNGISGAPIYNTTINRLCGMAARAGVESDGTAKLWYIDVAHIVPLIKAVHCGGSHIEYCYNANR